MKRAAGTLLHITSLPENFGIGTFGIQAYKFIDFLKKSGQKYWQVLPIGPTGFGDSPYQAFSGNAINPYFIDLEMLFQDGLLNNDDYSHINWGDNPEKVDYGKIFEHRFNILKKAFINFKKRDQPPLLAFIKEQPWVNDYALFMALKQHFAMVSFTFWPEDIKSRKKSAINKYSIKLKNEIDFWIFLQFMAYNQWKKLKKYANSLDIKIIGDLPFYVGLDSAEVWASPELFLLNKDFAPTAVAGCPPDDFSKNGQLWGNPIYNWKYFKSTDYEWWINRFAKALDLFDTVRIDHFRGFDSFYTIEYHAQNAKNGNWQKGPRMDFFNVLKSRLCNVDVIAEDLGFITKSAKKLVERTKFPGMKVLQYAFDFKSSNEFLPHNYDKNCVVYLGTHDNDTVIGWKNSAKKSVIDYAKRYGAFFEDENFNWNMIRLAYASVADLAIIRMQDFLALNSCSRMNTPATLGKNWVWRLKSDYDNDELSEKIKKLTLLYGR